MLLNIDRAREILSSNEEIDVKYKGKSVWINSINPAIGNAFVVTRDGTTTHHQVSVEDLQE